MGHNYINNERLVGVIVSVKDGNKVIQTVDTKKSNDFTLRLQYGRNYTVYFNHPFSPTMYLELNASQVPEEKHHYNMTHEMNVNFYYRNDEDVDTTVFSKPFARIVYNGESKMVSDTAYDNAFDRHILKELLVDKIAEGVIPDLPVTLCGKLSLSTNASLPVVYKTVTLLDAKGKAIKSTHTNRSGDFAFTGIKTKEVAGIKVEAKENDLNGAGLNICNSKKDVVSSGKCMVGKMETKLDPPQVIKLIDNNYSTNIGGKLILNSVNKKKFLANKTVYLCNKRNTIIKKTTTNVMGSFVFEDVKPDNTYFIGVDSKEAVGNERIDFLNKDDKFVSTLDTLAGNRKSIKVHTDFNQTFNDISISDDEMKMNINAKVYGDNTSNPIGKLKILLLNDAYQVIDSALTDDFGAFRFKYLPFLKRFYLSAENNNNILDVFNNILMYSNDDKLIKIMTHEKGKKFIYKPMSAEMSRLKNLEMDDPWLDLVSGDKPFSSGTRSLVSKKRIIIENILFENNKYELLPQAKMILDKVILVMNSNKKIRIEISAHTDSKGNDDDNLKLSQLRAKSAREYITAAGIDLERLVSIGYGETKPVNKCTNNSACSEMEHAQNRRVEFKILEE